MTVGVLSGHSTYEDDSHHRKDQEGDILFSGVFGFFHRLPRLYDGDLLLLQRYKIVQLVSSSVANGKSGADMIEHAPTLVEIPSAVRPMSSKSCIQFWISVSNDSMLPVVLPRESCGTHLSNFCNTSSCSLVM